MELIICSIYNTDTVQTMMEGVKKQLHDTIITDEDIAFHWSILTIEVEKEEGAVLLGMMMNLFITIRFFSKSLMEMYKQEAKKSTQKSKPLRRKLHKTTCNGYSCHDLYGCCHQSAMVNNNTCT